LPPVTAETSKVALFVMVGLLAMDPEPVRAS
jgi:hypothetical protein